MPVSRAELILYRSAESSDAASNGGRMSSSAVVSGLASNVFPRAGETERTAGSTKYRKVHYKAAAADDSPLYNALIFLENYTVGDDSIVAWLGTHTDTQTDITGSEQRYGAGQLSASVNAGVTSIDVDVEDWSVNPIFADTMYIRISDKANIDGAGNEEIVQINAAPSAAGDTITLSFTPALANAYAAASTRVAGLIEVGPVFSDVQPLYSSFVDTSAGSGAYDDTTYPLVLDSIATVYQEWTLTFTSSTAFDIVGDELGNVGSGNTSSGASPNNSDFSAPYFTLSSSGFSGAWQVGDTITFTTTPSAVPLWLRRDIPSGASAASNNKAILAIDAES